MVDDLPLDGPPEDKTYEREREREREKREGRQPQEI